MIRTTNRENKGKYIKIPVIWVMVVIVIGLGLLLIGSSVFFIKNSEFQDISRGLGISIIGGAFIAWAITYLIDKYNLEEIVGSMEDVRNSFKLIKSCEDNGLLKIYEPYDMRYKHSEKGGKASEDFKRDIKEKLQSEEKEIKICGLSLREFFSDGRKFDDEMRKAFKRMSDNNEFSVKILLMHPESDFKKQREVAEDKFAKLKLGKDLDQSIEWLESNIKSLKNKGDIMDNIRFYDATPDFFLFITSQCVIFENQHMGTFQLEKETDEGVQSSGLGGHVPAFMFDNQSSIYNYLSAHFDYYFEKKLVNKLSGMDKKLEESLDKDIISEDLKKKFEAVGVSLSGNATIRKEETDKWVLTDGEEIHIVKKEKGELYIEKQNEYHAGTLNEWLKSKAEQN
jgi:hypothetical protein